MESKINSNGSEDDFEDLENDTVPYMFCIINGTNVCSSLKTAASLQ